MIGRLALWIFKKLPFGVQLELVISFTKKYEDAFVRHYGSQRAAELMFSEPRLH